MNWIFLLMGGLCEVGFTSCLGKANASTGLTRWWWLLGFLVALSLSMYLLYKATSGQGALPLGTAYAVWTGIGAVGTVILGITLFHEPVTFWRLFFIFTLVASIVGLKLVSN